MKHQRYQTYAEAIKDVSETELHRICNQISYNEQDAKHQLKRHERDALSWHVIEGKLYYLIECDIKIMHRLELGMSVIHDGPFYRLNWVDTDQDTVDMIDRMIAKDPSLPLKPAEVGSRAFLCGNEKGEIAQLSREMKARKYYAKQNWIMTTESSLFFDMEKHMEKEVA